jgi:hypothetical protein
MSHECMDHCIKITVENDLRYTPKVAIETGENCMHPTGIAMHTLATIHNRTCEEANSDYRKSPNFM